MKIDIGTGKEELAENWGDFIITGVIDLHQYKVFLFICQEMAYYAAYCNLERDVERMMGLPVKASKKVRSDTLPKRNFTI